MDCSLPGSSVHEIFQARVLQWGAIAFSAATVATDSLQPTYTAVNDPFIQQSSDSLAEYANQMPAGTLTNIIMRCVQHSCSKW